MIIEWQTWKQVASQQLHLSYDALHVLGGLSLFLVVCLIFRWRPSDWRAWAVVLIAECFNEAMDMVGMIDDDGVIYIWSCVKDLITTMFPPTILAMAARYSSLFGATRSPSGDETEVPAAAPGGERDVV